MEYWSNGVLEEEKKLATPSLQYSITPLLRSSHESRRGDDVLRSGVHRARDGEEGGGGEEGPEPPGDLAGVLEPSEPRGKLAGVGLEHNQRGDDGGVHHRRMAMRWLLHPGILAIRARGARPCGEGTLAILQFTEAEGNMVAEPPFPTAHA